MRQSLLRVLLLATVALSSSSVLSELSSNVNTVPLGLNIQATDNTYSNSYPYTKSFYHIFCNKITNTLQQNVIPELCRLYRQKDDVNQDNKETAEYHTAGHKEQDYNGGRFRKKQWHNYPRQLDRLHSYFYERHKPNDIKRTPEYADPVTSHERTTDDLNIDDIENTANEYLDTPDLYSSIIYSKNPLIILKVRLSHGDDKIGDDGDTSMIKRYSYQPNQEGKMMTSNPYNIYEISDEEIEDLSGDTDVSDDAMQPDAQLGNPRSKRIFSLWSRLQTLSHKGHELQHRRHLHAFYGLPDDVTGGTLTAETRATLMRPPGSPLRWG